MPASSARPTETSPIQRQPQFRVWRVLKQFVIGAAVVAVGICGWALLYPSRVPAALGLIVENLTGANPNPIELQRPVAPPQLSAAAQLGKKIFFDPTLSASGRQSCA
ncbi:cytochrome c peroxidase, partial [Paraburkholderia dipogonis]